nr:hypothetical protein [Tanacetum cinerariifolium]
MKNTSLGIGVFTNFEDTMSVDTPVGVASAIQEGFAPSVVDMTIEMGKQNSLNDTTILESFPPLSTPLTTTASNAHGKSLYANITSKPSGKKVNVHTLFTPRGNWIDVKVAYPVAANYVRNTWGKYRLVCSMLSSSIRLFSFQFSSVDELEAMLKNGPWSVLNNPLILKKWHPNENLLKEDVNIVPDWVKLYGVPVTAFNKDGLSAIATKFGTPLMLDSYTSDMYNIVVAMPKISRECHYTCNVHVEYEWKPPRCSSCKVFGHVHEECIKNTGAEYRPVTKKPNDSSSGKKKKGVEPTTMVSNSNPFEVLNLVDTDREFGTNRGTDNLVINEATSSGSFFINIDNDRECASNTPIRVKIDKIKRQISEGKLRLFDNDGNSLVPMRIMEGDSEVKLVFNDVANLGIPTNGNDVSVKAYGTNSLLEQ